MAKKNRKGPATLRVFKWGHRKQPDMFLDASTPEREAGAYLQLFEAMKEWGVYGDLEEIPPPPAFPEGHVKGCLCDSCKAAVARIAAAPAENAERDALKKLYDLASKGNARAARQLIEARNGNDWERVETIQVETYEAEYEKSPNDEWGVSKPCAELYVTTEGYIRWFRHGRFDLDATAHASVEAARAYAAKWGKPQSEANERSTDWTGVKLKPEAGDAPDTKIKGKVTIDSVYVRQLCDRHRRERARFGGF
jgi:hypothetical protein